MAEKTLFKIVVVIASRWVLFRKRAESARRYENFAGRVSEDICRSFTDSDICEVSVLLEVC